MFATTRATTTKRTNVRYDAWRAAQFQTKCNPTEQKMRAIGSIGKMNLGSVSAVEQISQQELSLSPYLSISEHLFVITTPLIIGHSLLCARKQQFGSIIVQRCCVTFSSALLYLNSLWTSLLYTAVVHRITNKRWIACGEFPSVLLHFLHAQRPPLPPTTSTSVARR